MATAVKVEGLRELRKALTQIDPELRKELKTINRKSVDPVYRRALTEVPKRTGRLASTIRILGSQRAGQVAAGRKSVPYAGPIHWGWPKHNIAPNPFLERALDQSRNSVKAIWQTELQRVVDKAMRRTL